MIAVILAAASILGERALSPANPARQAMSISSLGQVVVRLDAAGFVLARSCDGKLRHVGDIPTKPLRVHISNDGDLDGLVWDPALTAGQQAAFRKIMLAVGYSDWRRLEQACIPVAGADLPAPDDLTTADLRSAAP